MSELFRRASALLSGELASEAGDVESPEYLSGRLSLFRSSLPYLDVVGEIEGASVGSIPAEIR